MLLDTGGLKSGDVDVLIGGPPCQPFSKSGYWASGDARRLADPRADTLGQYLRVLRDTLPKAFLLENVPGLAYRGKDEGVEAIRKGLTQINAEAGTNYQLSVRSLNAAEFGVPQLRQRVFVIGSREGLDFRFPTATHAPPDCVLAQENLEPFRTTWDAIGDLPTELNEPELSLTGKWADLLSSIPEGQNYLWHTGRGGGVPLFGWRRRYWSFLLKLAKNLPSWTIQAQPGPATGPFHWSNRKLSPSEMGRLHLEALELRDCNAVYASDPGRTPFYIVFETPGGERHGLLAYPYLANAKITRGRPVDEHRFQVNLKGVLEVAVDKRELITTIFVGIDLERKIFVAADPLMNTPAPMSRSIEFKEDKVSQIMDIGWVAWERNRLRGKARSRPSYVLEEDVRTEVLVGGKQERLLDLIFLERIARGLDPGERHLVADKLQSKPMGNAAHAISHKLLEELGVAPEALFDLIQRASRLKMAVRGWVAESHLEEFLGNLSGVTECRRIEAEGQPDITLRWKGGAPIQIECKNTLRDTYADGRPKVDFQRTRASMGDPCSRYYTPGDFPILVACLHAVTENWEFRFALTSELPPHRKCEGHLSNTIAVEEPLFTADAQILFDKCSGLSY